MQRRHFALLIALPLLLLSCTGTTTALRPTPSPSISPQTSPSPATSPSPSASPSSSPTPLASPLPSPTPLTYAFPGLLPGTTPHLTKPAAATCTGTWGNTDPVAAVAMHGATTTVLRDYADEAHPRTLCTFSLPVMSILDPHHVVALDIASTATNTPQSVIELPSGRVFDIGVTGNVDAIDSNFSQVLWYSTGNTSVLYDTWKGGSTTIQAYGQLSGICGVEPVAGDFSRDARYGFAVWLQGAAYLNIVNASTHQGVLAIKPPASGEWPAFQGPEMPLWNPTSDQLFWTQGGGIKTWTPSEGVSTLRTGLTWSWPTMSPDGTHLAYVLDSSPGATVWLLNPQTGASEGKIGSGTQAMFLTKDWVWVKNMAGGCGQQAPATYIYDLRDHTITASSLEWVYATWPATSALGG